MKNLKRVVLTTRENHYPIKTVFVSTMEEEEVHKYFQKCKVIHNLSEMFNVVAHRSKATKINEVLVQINDLQGSISELLNDEDAKTPLLAKLRYMEAVLQVLSEESQALLQEENLANRKEIKPNLVTEAVFIGKTKKAKKLWNKQRILEELELSNLSKAKRKRLQEFLEKLL